MAGHLPRATPVKRAATEACMVFATRSRSLHLRSAGVCLYSPCDYPGLAVTMGGMVAVLVL